VPDRPSSMQVGAELRPRASPHRTMSRGDHDAPCAQGKPERSGKSGARSREGGTRRAGQRPRNALAAWRDRRSSARGWHRCAAVQWISRVDGRDVPKCSIKSSRIARIGSAGGEPFRKTPGQGFVRKARPRGAGHRILHNARSLPSGGKIHCTTRILCHLRAGIAHLGIARAGKASSPSDGAPGSGDGASRPNAASCPAAAHEDWQRWADMRSVSIAAG
jgi:hypothetical protein